ncbi:MAG: OmpA family protein [Acidobacteriota bacterium]|nr:OmpA family protein [Acidobacteriota bacterium]
MAEYPLRIVPNKPTRLEPEPDDVLQLDDLLPETSFEFEEPAQPDDAEAMAQLRRLLLEPEQTQLGNILERLNNPRVRAREMSRPLPEAIRLRNAQDDALTDALAPTIVTAFHHSIKKDPRPVAEAISPLMGPAIRRAIAIALSSFVQTIDQTLKHSLSWQGFKWRFEALKSGKSFAEVVLYHTLVYRVEQVFLIHKQTGLLLHHVAADPTITKDADIVSGMLTAMQVAISNFARDSFGSGEEQIDTLDLGDREVWFESGVHAVLAVVIRGEAPETLRSDYFAPALEAIHVEQREAFDMFNGDASAFEGARPRLEECLQSQYQGRSEPAEYKIPTYIWLLLAAIVIALGVWGFFAWRDARRWNAYLNRLKQEPGIVITETGKENGKRFIAGLRDPLAADPMAILRKETVIDPSSVSLRLKDYAALEAPLVLARAKSLLEPPSSVELKFADGTLTASGLAPHDWVVETRRMARALPGVVKFDDRNLIDEDLKEPELLRLKIEQQVIRFVRGGAQLAAGQGETLKKLTADLQKLASLAPTVGRTFRVELIGHTDTEGDDAANMALSRQRADKVLFLLNSKQFPANSLTAVGVGSLQPVRSETSEADKEFNRSVSFKVSLLDPQQAKAQTRP